MRFILASFLLLLCTAAAHATVAARISSIGFDSCIRPDCWVPLIVQVTSDEDTPHTYDLQVVQYDLDGDEVVYTRPGVTVNSGTQRFWAYFKPESINGGLPVVGGDTQNDLAKRLRIFLAEPDTGRRVIQVATNGALPQALETGQLAGPTGQKLMLIVGRSPNVREFAPGSERRIGAAEECLFVQVDPKRLPENALAYQPVDAVVWTDADPGAISSDQWRALREYVAGGGVLVISQNEDRARMARFDEFLPVRVDAVNDWATIDPLRDILTPPRTALPKDAEQHTLDPYAQVHPPYHMAHATALPDAWIERWVTWPDQTQTPYIARHLYGMGCVAWIAQDISDPSIASIDFGWPRLWERVMDWHDNEAYFPEAEPLANRERLRDKFETGVARDLGVAFLSGMDLQSKSAALITVAFVFFIGYWVLAGPGAYLFLASRKQTQWSWFVFGAIALLATLFTVLISQVVLRGPPQVRHVSLIRVRCDNYSAASVRSRFGIYLPRDERADIALAAHDGDAPADIAPLSIDPKYAHTDVRLRDSHYAVPVENIDADTRVGIAVPFRSTLKKLQAAWGDDDTGRLSGTPALSTGDSPITGRLSNNSNVTLSNVILIFHSPTEPHRDEFLALKEWKHGETLELADVWKKATAKPITLASQRVGLSVYDVANDTRGPWEYAQNWLYEDLRQGVFTDQKWDDSSRGYARSFPLVSLYDRCAPMSNLPNESTRVDLFRRGVRDWNVSPAVAAGAMVVIGQATGPTPKLLTVDGSTPAGTGQFFYQFIVPMDLSQVNHPTTQPAG